MDGEVAWKGCRVCQSFSDTDIDERWIVKGARVDEVDGFDDEVKVQEKVSCK